MKSQKKSPRILILDIETAPVLANVWGMWKQNVPLKFINKDWYILSFAAKFTDKKKVHYFDQSEADDIEDDKNLLIVLSEFLDEADIVVAHNGRKFDVRKINTRLLMHGIDQPSPYKVVDTLKIAKKHFAFTSNKLEFLTDTLCETKKLKHNKFPGVELWVEVLKGNKAAWKEMKVYNIFDVKSLEELYFKLRPWDDTHPNVSNFSGKMDKACVHCGSEDVHRRGSYFTKTGRYQRYQCNECKGWMRDRISNNIEEKKNLLTNLSNY